MKICIFSSNQPRHLYFVERISEVADDVLFFCEVTTLFSGARDGLYRKSEIMENYMSRVRKAERDIFSEKRSIKGNKITIFPMLMGDVNYLENKEIEECDLMIVFGASYIKSSLVDILIKKRAINIHMGISPYYRGSSCNFWALYDRRPEMVGATIHFISKGLDSGEILFHCLPGVNLKKKTDGFDLGMMVVEAAIEGLAKKIEKGNIFNLQPIEQDRSKEIRYSRGKEFTDEVASDYLSNKMMTTAEIEQKLGKRDLGQYIRPYILER